MEANPLLRWPNENIQLYEGARPSFDDLTQAQFVGGVLATVQELSLPMFKDGMLNELKETMHLSCTAGWPIAKAAFGEVMSKVEQGRIGWNDPDGLWRARMDGKYDAYMGQNRGSRTGGEGYYQTPQYARPVREGPPPQYNNQDKQGTRRQHKNHNGVKEFTCRNFNAGFCREQDDHWDPSLPHKYIHACTTCHGNPNIPLRLQRHRAKHCTGRPY